MAGYGNVEMLPLPSGNKVRVKRISLLTQVRLKQIPPNLISAVWSVFGRDGDGPAPPINMNERAETMIGLMDAAIKAVVVDLKIVDEGLSETTLDAEGFTIGQVNIRDIPDTDKALIFGFCQGSVNASPITMEVERDLKSFPPEPARETPGSGGDSLRDTTEQHDSPQPEVGVGPRL
jgi:hypothetical protein